MNFAFTKMKTKLLFFFECKTFILGLVKLYPISTEKGKGYNLTLEISSMYYILIWQYIFYYYKEKESIREALPSMIVF